MFARKTRFVNSGFAPNIVMFRQNHQRTTPTMNTAESSSILFGMGMTALVTNKVKMCIWPSAGRDAIPILGAARKRFSANQRDVTRPMFPHQSQNAFDQRIPRRSLSCRRSDFTSQVGLSP